MLNKGVKIIFGIVFSLFLLLLTLYTIRAFSPSHLDDVSPGIACEEDLLKKSDVYFIIPEFENKSISDNKQWCENIKSMNKTIGMHGIYHTYEEFNEEKTIEDITKGMNIFRECFGYYPSLFKPPQIAITKSNLNNLKKMNLKSYTKISTIFHKVYHCGDTGIVKNKWIDLF